MLLDSKKAASGLGGARSSYRQPESRNCINEQLDINIRNNCLFGRKGKGDERCRDKPSAVKRSLPPTDQPRCIQLESKIRQIFDDATTHVVAEQLWVVGG